METLIAIGIMGLLLTGVYQGLGFMQSSFTLENQKKQLTRDLQRTTQLLLEDLKGANPQVNFEDMSGNAPAGRIQIADNFFFYKLAIDPSADEETQIFDFIKYDSADGTPEIIQGFLDNGNLFLTREKSFKKKLMLTNIVQFDMVCLNRFEHKDDARMVLVPADGDAAYRNNTDYLSVGAILSIDITLLTDTGKKDLALEKMITQSFKVNLDIPARAVP